MSTEVLLMADVKDLGSEGDIVNVADGYARNYLFPKKVGAPVSSATKKQLEKIRKDREAERVVHLASAMELAKKIEKASCTIAVKVGEDSQLYGSVTTADVEKALKEQGVEIDKNMFLLDRPIKELGVFDVKIALHPEVEASVKVWVVEE